MIFLLSAIQDTVFTAVPRDGLQTAADLSLVVMAVGSGISLIAVTIVLIQIRRLLRTLNDQLKPVTERAGVAAENVAYVSALIREDVQKVNASIGAITDRLNDASEHMEDRVQEFNVLMEVVQGEAERVFIDTAAAVRGVKAGARSIGQSGQEEKASGSVEALESDSNAEAVLKIEGESETEAEQP